MKAMKVMMLTSLLVLAPAAHAQSGGMPDMSRSGAMSGMASSQAGEAPAPEDVAVRDCWIRLLPGQAPSAGYFTVENSGKQPVSLTGARADAFGMVMLHQTSRNQQGVMGMSPVDQVPVPAKGRVDFAPGGYHVMLEKPAKPLHVGDKIALTLAFGKQALTTQCDVRSPASTSK